jgi:tripartite-type tricarboxylate transporter receptor subunit TctC
MPAFASVVLSLACLLFCSVTVAQTPNKDPIRLVVGFAPGGPSDIAGRIAAEILSAKLGVSVVVENRAGASGSIAADAVANAKPDGNTLLVNVTADIVNPVINREPKSFITTRFAPVGLIATAPNVLVVHPSIPVHSAKELVAFVRSKNAENSLSYASAGLGTVSHLSGLLFASATGASIVHVPYKGTAAAQVDLLAGRVQIMFDSLSSGLVNAKSGKVKALAVTSPKRWPMAPELPTLEEIGLPETDMMAVFGLLAPAGTPKAVIDKLSVALLEGLRTPDVRARINQIGAEPGDWSPEAYGAYLSKQVERWQKLAAQGKFDVKN